MIPVARALAIHRCKALTVRADCRAVVPEAGGDCLSSARKPTISPRTTAQPGHPTFNASTICALPAVRSGRGIVNNVAALWGEIWRWVESVSMGGGGTGIDTWFAVPSKSTWPCRQGGTMLPTALYVPL